jgi:hypothetical protein
MEPLNAFVTPAGREPIARFRFVVKIFALNASNAWKMSASLILTRIAISGRSTSMNIALKTFVMVQMFALMKQKIVHLVIQMIHRSIADHATKVIRYLISPKSALNVTIITPQQLKISAIPTVHV